MKRKFYLIPLGMVSAFFWNLSHAFNMAEDLKGAKVVAEGTCPMGGVPYQCLLIKAKGGVYVVTVDRNGPLTIHEGKSKTVKESYEESETQLVWVRSKSKLDI